MFNSVVSMRELELELESVQLLPRRETLCVMRFHAGHGHAYDNGYGNGDNGYGNGDGGCGDNGCGGDNYGYDNGCGGDNYGYDNGYDDGCGDNYDDGCN